MMKKLFKTMIASILAACMMSITAYSASWVQAADGRWWYQHDDGSYTTNNWELIDGKYYYFDAQGWMLANATTPDGKYVGADGTMIEGTNSSSSALGSTANTTERLPASLNGYYITNKTSLPIKKYGDDILINLWTFDTFAGPNGGLGIYIEYNERVFDLYEDFPVDFFTIKYSFFNEKGQEVLKKECVTKLLIIGEYSLKDTRTIEIMPSELPQGAYSLVVTVTSRH